MDSFKKCILLKPSSRERGSFDVADNLLAAAEKQWEVHLRTQAMMARRPGAGAGAGAGAGTRDQDTCAAGTEAGDPGHVAEEAGRGGAESGDCDHCDNNTKDEDVPSKHAEEQEERSRNVSSGMS